MVGEQAELVFRLDVEVIDDDAEVVVSGEALRLPDDADVPGRRGFRNDAGARDGNWAPATLPASG